MDHGNYLADHRLAAADLVRRLPSDDDTVKYKSISLTEFEPAVSVYRRFIFVFTPFQVTIATNSRVLTR
jgi:hypothetical protein